MSALKVIVVPVETTLGTSYQVWLGDCVLAGYMIGCRSSLDEANELCVSRATHYGLKGYPYDPKAQEIADRRASFRLIEGGKS